MGGRHHDVVKNVGFRNSNSELKPEALELKKIT
jgi:hypothetical protein